MGNYVMDTLSWGISRENCQRAKILLAGNQQQERIALIATIKQNKKDKLMISFKTESAKYELNDECIECVVKGYNAMTNNIESDIVSDI